MKNRTKNILLISGTFFLINCVPQQINNQNGTKVVNVGKTIEPVNQNSPESVIPATLQPETINPTSIPSTSAPDNVVMTNSPDIKNTPSPAAPINIKNEMILVTGIRPIESFYIAKYETSQKEYQELMGNNPSIFKGENLPVENVSFFEAIKFCNAKNTKEGFPIAYDETTGKVINLKSYRLPTGEEWEYAANGGIKSEGLGFSGSSKLDEVAWYSDNSSNTTHITGSKKPNALGIYDMSGNVFEWCQNQLSTGSPLRMIRGGGWASKDEYNNIAKVNSELSNSKYNYIGFRIIKSF